MPMNRIDMIHYKRYQKMIKNYCKAKKVLKALMLCFALLCFELSSYTQQPVLFQYPVNSGLMPVGTEVVFEVFRAGKLSPVDTVIIQQAGMLHFQIPGRYYPGEFYLSFMAGGRKQSFPFLLDKRPDSIRLMVDNNISFQIFGDEAYQEHHDFIASLLDEANKLRMLSDILRSFPISTEYYKQTLKEYHNRVTIFNQNIDDAIKKSTTWISMEWPLHKWPEEIKPGIMVSDFSFLPVKDTMILHTSMYTKYLNEQMRMAVNNSNQDSALITNGKALAIRASKGHPLVYGWLIDYLQQGFEAIGFDRGIEILGEHIQHPDCLTSKKREIMYRLKGLETLKAGIRMPDRYLPNQDQRLQNVYQPDAKEKYRLLIFWAADCGYCHELFAELFPWWQQDEIRKQLGIITIDLSANYTEWKQTLTNLPSEALHLFAPSGISHPIANDYFILTTPVMFVVDKNLQIVSIPNTIKDLKKIVNL